MICVSIEECKMHLVYHGTRILCAWVYVFVTVCVNTNVDLAKDLLLNSWTHRVRLHWWVKRRHRFFSMCWDSTRSYSWARQLLSVFVTLHRWLSSSRWMHLLHLTCRVLLKVNCLFDTVAAIRPLILLKVLNIYEGCTSRGRFLVGEF